MDYSSWTHKEVDMSERLTLSLYLLVIKLKLVDWIEGNLCTVCTLHWSGFTRETDLIIRCEHINRNIYDKRLAQVIRRLRTANPLPFESRLHPHVQGTSWEAVTLG